MAVRKITWTFAGKKLTDPGALSEYQAEQDTPTDFLGRCNSYVCPLGRSAGYGYLLMKREDVDALSPTQSATLSITERNDATGAIVSQANITGLRVHRCWCLTLAEAGTAKAIYLVEVRDCRAQLWMGSVNKRYNIRMPAPDEDTDPPDPYYDDSLNGSSKWTWQEVIDDLWGNLPTCAGNAPTLPYSPGGQPENITFQGVSAWGAINTLLQKIGCEIALDPFTDTFSIVRMGTTSQTLSTTLTDLKADRLIYEYDPIDKFHVNEMPETIRVFFYRTEKYYGEEKDTVASANWEMDAVRTRDVATGHASASLGSVLTVWDDLSALVQASSGSVTNSAALTSRANEVADNIKNRLDTGRMRKVYSGPVSSIVPGAEVTRVSWHFHGHERWGHHTEIAFRPEDAPLWLFGDGSSPGDIASEVSERFRQPDFGRNQHPVWPRTDQIVEIKTSGQEVDGELVAANGDGLHEADVKIFQNGSIVTLEECWVVFIDDYDNLAGQVKVQVGDYYPARLYGCVTSGSDFRPLYAARHGSGNATSVGFPFELTATLVRDGTAAAETLDCNFSKTGIAITVDDFQNKFLGQIGYKGFCIYRPPCDDFLIVEMQRTARFIVATLSSPFSGGTASATLDDFWDGESPAAGQSGTVHDDLGVAHALGRHLSSGDKVICVWDDTVNEPTGRYVMIAHVDDFPWCKFLSDQKTSTSGDCDIYDANPVDDCAGNNPDTGTTLSIHVPKGSVVNQGDVRPYWRSRDGTLVSIWTKWSAEVGVNIDNFCPPDNAWRTGPVPGVKATTIYADARTPLAYLTETVGGDNAVKLLTLKSPSMNDFVDKPSYYGVEFNETKDFIVVTTCPKITGELTVGAKPPSVDPAHADHGYLAIENGSTDKIFRWANDLSNLEDFRMGVSDSQAGDCGDFSVSGPPGEGDAIGRSLIVRAWNDGGGGSSPRSVSVAFSEQPECGDVELNYLDHKGDPQTTTFTFGTGGQLISASGAGAATVIPTNQETVDFPDSTCDVHEYCNEPVSPALIGMTIGSTAYALSIASDVPSLISGFIGGAVASLVITTGIVPRSLRWLRGLVRDHTG